MQRVGSEPLYNVGDAVVVGVAESYDEPARMCRRRIVFSAPRIHVDVAVRVHRQVPRVTNRVGEHRCTKAGRKGKAPVVSSAFGVGRDRGGRGGGRISAAATLRFRARDNRRTRKQGQQENRAAYCDSSIPAVALHFLSGSQKNCFGELRLSHPYSFRYVSPVSQRVQMPARTPRCPRSNDARSRLRRDSCTPRRADVR